MINVGNEQGLMGFAEMGGKTQGNSSDAEVLAGDGFGGGFLSSTPFGPPGSTHWVHSGLLPH